MKKNIMWMIAAALNVLVGALLLGQATKGKKGINVDEAKEMIQRDSTIVILDCRTPEEYTGELGHIAHSILIPVQELEARVTELDKYKGRTFLAVCRTGRRSATATDVLTKHGFHAMNVEGGMVKWNEEHFPTEK